MIFWVFNNKKNKIVRRLNILIALNSETLSSYLTPVLAQYNIKYQDFIDLFVIEFSKRIDKVYTDLFKPFYQKNKYLSNEELIIKVTLIFDNIGKFFMEFNNPTVNVVCKYFFSSYYFYKVRKRYFFFFCYKLTYFYTFLLNLGPKIVEHIIFFKNLFNYFYNKNKIFEISFNKLHNNIKLNKYLSLTYNKKIQFLKKKFLFNNKIIFFFSFFCLKNQNKFYDILKYFKILNFLFFSNIYVGVCSNLISIKNFLQFFFKNFLYSKIIIRGIKYQNNFCSIFFFQNELYLNINIINIILWLLQIIYNLILFNYYGNYKLFYYSK